MARHNLGDPAQAAIGGNRKVEGARTERGAKRLRVEWIRVDMLNGGRNLIEFVAAGMEHRDGIATRDHAVDNQVASGSGAADDESFQWHLPWEALGLKVSLGYLVLAAADQSCRPRFRRNLAGAHMQRNHPADADSIA
jgi:hypothetical protein